MEYYMFILLMKVMKLLLNELESNKNVNFIWILKLVSF